MWGLPREAPGGSVSKASCRQEGASLLWFLCKKLTRHSKQAAGFSLASLNNFHRLWWGGPVPGWLVPSWSDEGWKCWPGVCHQKRWWCVDSGPVIFVRMKGALEGKLIISRNRLALGRTVSPGSVGPQMSKQQREKTCFLPKDTSLTL